MTSGKPVPRRIVTRTLFGYGLYEFDHFLEGHYPIYAFRGLVAKEAEAQLWLHLDAAQKELTLWQRDGRAGMI